MSKVFIKVKSWAVTTSAFFLQKCLFDHIIDKNILLRSDMLSGTRRTVILFQEGLEYRKYIGISQQKTRNYI